MRPTVSVIIPNYNHADYLRKRVETVMAQTYTNFEVLLLDDASTDGSLHVIEALLKEYPTIQFYANKKNTGSPFAQWNKGVELAKGKYLWIAESDDYCAPTLLQTLVETIEQEENIALAYAQSYLVNEQNEIINSYAKNLAFIYKTDAWEQNFVKNGADACRNWLVFNNPIPNASGALMLKSTFKKVGGGDATMRLNGDWLLYCKLLTHSKLAFNAQPLNYFRVHQQTQRHKAKATTDTYLELIRINTYLRQNIKNIEAQADKALERIAGWWKGSLPRQIKTRENQRKNRALFKIFRKHKKNLGLHIFLTYVILGSRFILNRSGLLKPVKQVRKLLFPGKYFDY